MGSCDGAEHLGHGSTITFPLRAIRVGFRWASWSWPPEMDMSRLFLIPMRIYGVKECAAEGHFDLLIADRYCGSQMAGHQSEEIGLAIRLSYSNTFALSTSSDKWTTVAVHDLWSTSSTTESSPPPSSSSITLLQLPIRPRHLDGTSTWCSRRG